MGREEGRGKAESKQAINEDYLASCVFAPFPKYPECWKQLLEVSVLDGEVCDFSFLQHLGMACSWRSRWENPK